MCKFSAKFNEPLNSVKLTILTPFLINLPEKEIIEGLENYRVCALYKLQDRVEEVLVPTGGALLNFEHISYLRKLVQSGRPYYHNSMRCETCQKLGHTIKK